MAFTRKKKSLYEVVGKAWSKSSYDKTLEKPHPAPPPADEPISQQAAKLSEKLAMWPRKPRLLQFSAGRIEMSIPYELAVALLLGVILLALVVFRLGQSSSPTDREIAEAQAETPAARPVIPAATELAQPPEPAEEPTAAAIAERMQQPEPTGDNRIVIQTYQLRPHLVPVQRYFARFGIQTEIRKIGDWFYLVTADRYENPERPGTDGFAAKQRIIELGANYKAPLGYETFGDKPFYDAYGMRFED
ncbi:MAG: hypothetical protein JSW23_09890 [Planctomycetota bacterium]|nr:MAG: hypothetical protein JSW23_09890 [Planctomycetota bacterium]